MGGQCLRGPVIYRAAIAAYNKTEHYTGLAGNNFKHRVNKHNSVTHCSKIEYTRKLQDSVYPNIWVQTSGYKCSGLNVRVLMC